MKVVKQFVIILFLFISTFFTSCGIYSFTGASIPPEVKTISIQHIANQATLVQPTLAQTLTDGLKDRFMAQTTLNIVNNNGDMDIEGTIINYMTAPVAIQSDDKAALNRLTITLKIKFTNSFDEKQSFETNFSRYEDYDSRLSLPSVEEGLIKNISEALIDDIFNKTVVNW